MHSCIGSIYPPNRELGFDSFVRVCVCAHREAPAACVNPVWDVLLRLPWTRRGRELGVTVGTALITVAGVAVGVDTAACAAAGLPNLPIPLAGRYYTTTAIVVPCAPRCSRPVHSVDRRQRVARPSSFDLMRVSRAGNTSASVTMQPCAARNSSVWTDLHAAQPAASQDQPSPAAPARAPARAPACSSLSFWPGSCALEAQVQAGNMRLVSPASSVSR